MAYASKKRSITKTGCCKHLLAAAFLSIETQPAWAGGQSRYGGFRKLSPMMIRPVPAWAGGQFRYGGFRKLSPMMIRPVTKDPDKWLFGGQTAHNSVEGIREYQICTKRNDTGRVRCGTMLGCYRARMPAAARRQIPICQAAGLWNISYPISYIYKKRLLQSRCLAAAGILLMVG